MEFETWWLLVIPASFAGGWLASRLDQRSAKTVPAGLPDAYFKGLNFLLNEQPDKAVDAFIDVVKLEPETIELHFALGNLFRRRGEIDRAIRVHENLISRTTLSADERSHALFELGQDYLKAGLLDRAEDSFSRLEASQYANAALRLRLDSAQMVKDWPLAGSLLDRINNHDEAASLKAHFLCEQAAQRLATTTADRFELASALLHCALQSDPQHVRSRLMLGQVAADQGLESDALRHWDAVVETDGDYLCLIAPRWAGFMELAGKTNDAIAVLEKQLAKKSSVDLFSALVSLREKRDGSELALTWAHDWLQKEPSLLGLGSYRKAEVKAEEKANLKAGLAGESNKDGQLLEALVKHQSAKLSRYCCGNCGFKARQYYWQCPGCNRWDSYAPRRLEDLKIDL